MRKLFDYGFANYALYRADAARFSDIPIIGGDRPLGEATHSAFSAVVKKSELSRVECIVSIPNQIKAPISIGDEIGKAVFKVGEIELGSLPITSVTSSAKMNYWQVLLKLLQRVIFSREF